MNSDPSTSTQSDQIDADQQDRYPLAAISCLVGLVGIAVIAAALTIYFVVLPMLPTPTPTLLPSLGATATPAPTYTNTPAPAAQIVPTSPQVTSPQKPDVEISVICALLGEFPSYAEVDQPVVLTWAWGAATEAYGQDYIDAASFSVQIDGQSVDVSSVAPVFSIESDEYWATWSLPPRTFAAGTHQTILNVTLSRQVTDGLDLDLDGNLDLYGPGLSTFDPCDIIVTEARVTEPPPIHDTDLPPAQWPLVLFDSFDTNDNEWVDFADLSGTEPLIFDVNDGKYTWSVQSDPGSLGVGWPFWANKSPEVSDLYASVEANVTGEIKDATYGLVFRASATGNYLFGLNDQGLFTVEAIVYNQSNKILIKPTETSAVQSGETNRLSVVAIGSHLMFYINDQWVAELDDDTLQRGFVGVYVNLVGGQALAEVEFDNFELRAP